MKECFYSTQSDILLCGNARFSRGNKNKLRTFQPYKEKKKNSQPQTKFTGPHKKRVFISYSTRPLATKPDKMVAHDIGKFYLTRQVHTIPSPSFTDLGKNNLVFKTRRLEKMIWLKRFLKQKNAS